MRCDDTVTLWTKGLAHLPSKREEIRGGLSCAYILGNSVAT